MIRLSTYRITDRRVKEKTASQRCISELAQLRLYDEAKNLILHTCLSVLTPDFVMLDESTHPRTGLSTKNGFRMLRLKALVLSR